MRAKCYFCDSELQANQYKFQVGPMDEPVCEECRLKTVNRQKAKAEEDRGRSSG